MFVGNLSFDTTETDLQDLFAAQGVVQEVSIVTDRETGRSRGFAFVTMSTPEEAQAAISALAGQSLNGREITVTEARPREARPSGGGGGGGYQGGSGYQGGGGYRGTSSGSGSGGGGYRKSNSGGGGGGGSGGDVFRGESSGGAGDQRERGGNRGGRSSRY